jgi:hypothetical protein
MRHTPRWKGERPSGPILGAREEAEPISPPTVRIMTILTSSPPGGPPMVFIDDVRKVVTTPTAIQEVVALAEEQFMGRDDEE